MFVVVSTTAPTHSPGKQHAPADFGDGGQSAVFSARSLDSVVTKLTKCFQTQGLSRSVQEVVDNVNQLVPRDAGLRTTTPAPLPRAPRVQLALR